MRLLTRWTALRDRRAFRWATDLLLFGAVLAGVGAWQGRDHVQGPAPAFQLNTLTGESKSLADFRGKPVLLQFWAPWCGVCKLEARNINWVRSLVGDRAHVLSVASSFEDPREVEAFAKAHELKFPVLLGGPREEQAFRVRAFPTVYFLDSEGNVKRSAVGYTTTAGLLWRLFL